MTPASGTPDSPSVLLLSSWFPWPANNGSKLRILNVIRQLAKEYQITLLSLSPQPLLDRDQAGPLLRYCRHVGVAQAFPYRPLALASLAGLLSPTPRSLLGTYSKDMEALVRRELESGSYDVLIASQLGTLLYALPSNGMPRLLEEAEVRLLQSGRRPGLAGVRHGLTMDKLGRFLRRHARDFRAWTVASQEERASLQALAPNLPTVRVIPNGIEWQRYDADYGPPEPDTLIYPGALTFAANLDAMDYFVGGILPLIRARRPGVRLRITGEVEGVPRGRLPSGEGVEYTGHLPDIRPAVARSAVCVCPVRLGGGTRLKVLEALALSTPVVSTSRGAEGLEVIPGEHLLIGDDPQTFADQVVELLGWPARGREIAARGRELVRARYDWEVIGEELRALVRQVREGSA